MLNKKMLKDIFSTAREQELAFVVIGIEAGGIKEAVVVPAESFDDKERFYMNAYGDDLNHALSHNVRIFNFIAVDSTEGIEYVFDIEGLSNQCEGEQHTELQRGTLSLPRTDKVNEMRDAIAQFVIKNLENDVLGANEINAIARLADVVSSMPTCISIGDSDR